MDHSRLILAQLNPIVGDLAGNAEKILTAYREAAAHKPAIVICPELALTGYSPEDLILMPAFRAEAMKEARRIAEATGEAGLIFGSIWEETGAVYNTGIFAAEGRIQHMHHKIMLPNDGVFDEKRVFTPGHAMKGFEWLGVRYLLMVCEDIWHLQYAEEAALLKPETIIVINASPYARGKQALRKKIVASAAQASGAPVVYANLLGAQDDLVFDGGSIVCDAKGYVVFEAPQFESGLFEPGAQSATPMDDLETVWSALCLGLSDYVNKNNFPGVLLGLSGGIDSAISAAVAVDALGANRVRGVLLPSPYTSPESNEDATESARLLGIEIDTVPISPAMKTMAQTLHPLMGDIMEEVAIGGNIQARIRGLLLMALSNQSGFMLLSTGNKSEVAVGYTTLYGDSCGGYNVLKDVYKTLVYDLARWRNEKSKVIPERSITKAPSAELKPGQKDEDQLPPYEILDAILALHIEQRKSAAEITAQGFDKATVERVIALVRNSEYKRRQSCPGVKITSMMFGRDRRYPLTNRYMSSGST